MLSLTKMLTEENFFGDRLRYAAGAGLEKNGTAPGKGPVIVWNYTNRCNLACRHCYAAEDLQPAWSGPDDCGDRDGVSANRNDAPANQNGAPSNRNGAPVRRELTTREAMGVIDDLAAFHVPVILFSGGEPLCREDFFDLARYAREKGIRVTLSTNGTLITEEMAKKIKDCGIGYVGISLDGKRETNDAFRGCEGAFDRALEGIRNCRRAGQKVGLRFTLNRMNYRDVPEIMDLMTREDIDRICFYHLVYSGRGSQLLDEDLSHDQTREVMDQIIETTQSYCGADRKREILTVDNHTDGVYLYLKYKDTEPEKADRILQFLRNNGGNRCGMAIGCIDAFGDVHPDQFTRRHTFGNVLDRPFGEIWTDGSHPILAGLKDRKPLLPDTCVKCRWLDLCNGNFRARAEAVSGDFWGFDPACYLTEEERYGQNG